MIDFDATCKFILLIYRLQFHLLRNQKNQLEMFELHLSLWHRLDEYSNHLNLKRYLHFKIGKPSLGISCSLTPQLKGHSIFRAFFSKSSSMCSLQMHSPHGSITGSNRNLLHLSFLQMKSSILSKKWFVFILKFFYLIY